MNNARIRVAHICPLGTGGITSMVLNICEHLDREMVNFDYLVYKNEKEINEERAVALGGKKLIADNSNGKNGAMRFFIKFFKVYKVLKQEKPDVFHMNVSTPYDTLVGIAAKAAGVRHIIAHSHDAGAKKRSRLKKMIFSICRVIMPLYVDEYYACSTEAAEYLFPKRIAKNKRYVYIKNGISVEKFKFSQETRDALREKYNLHDKLVVGNVGRFMKQKNQAFLLDVFSKIAQEKENAVLLLVGVGELEDELKEKVKKLGLENRVIFWGATDKVNEVMLMMDVFVMTSLHEGLPVVGIEAQASGLPCVFSDVITREVKVSDNVEFLSLGEPVDKWAKTVIELSEKEIDRTKGVENVSNAGFRIEDVSKDLQERYIAMTD